MAIISRCSNLLIILALAFMLFSCNGFRKRTQSRDSTSKAETLTELAIRKTLLATTAEFGDTLAGETLLTLDGGNVKAESKGLKVNVKIVPIYDDVGKLTGFKATHHTIAKPTKLTNSSTKEQSNETTKQSSSVRQSAKEKQIHKKGSGSMLWGALFTLIILILIILLIIRYGLRR